MSDPSTETEPENPRNEAPRADEERQEEAPENEEPNRAGERNDDYVPSFHTIESFPTPKGRMAKVLLDSAPATQREEAEKVFNIINNAHPNLAELNMETLSSTILLFGVPESANIRGGYAAGFGTEIPGQTSGIENKLLVLHGEGGGDIGYPEVKCIPPDMANQRQLCLCPSDIETKAALSAAGPALNGHLFRARDIQSEALIFSVAPIPGYLAPDLLDGDLKAALLYERILASDYQSPMMEHARTFVKAMMVGPLRQNDPKPYMAPGTWNTGPHVDAKRWRTAQCNKFFPTIFQPEVQSPQRGTATPDLCSPERIARECSKEIIREVFREWYPEEFRARAKPPTPAKQPEVVDLSNDTEKKVSELELENMRKMCGQQPLCDISMLPTWFQHLFLKNQDDKDRDMIVAQTLSQSPRFDEAKIPIYPELKKMIMSRKWAGGEAGGTPRYPYACYGITPFAMLDLNEDEIATLDLEDGYLQSATCTTPSDIKASKTKLQAKIPETGSKCRLVILKFTNLLQLLFGGASPMYKRMIQICKCLRLYPTDILEMIPTHAWAAVFWIIHLQSRHYAQGKMYKDSPYQELLPEFERLLNLLLARAVHQVSHATVPLQLIPAGKRKRLFNVDSDDESTDDEEPPNKYRKNGKGKRGGGGGNRKKKKEEEWHPTLKEKLGPALKTAEYPGLKDICKFCKLNKDDKIVTESNKKVCRAYLMFGRCKFGKRCNLDHKKASEAQVKEILEKFEAFIEKPDELTSGKD